MMKTLSITFLLLFLISSFIENSSSQGFELPTEEILKKYLNLSREEFIKKCTDKDKCLAEKTKDIEKLKKDSGEKLINYIVNEAKKLPSVTENDWNNLIQNNCQSSSFFLAILELTIVYTGQCLSPEERPNDDTIKKGFKEYLDIYCSRVKEEAKKKYQSG